MGTLFWFVIAIAAAIFEIIIPALVTIWFALAAGIVWALSYLFPSLLSLAGEWKCFLALSIVFLIGTRPFTKHILEGKKSDYQADAVGSTLYVTKRVGEGSYEGRWKGTIWSLESEDHTLQKGDKVRILGYKGNRILVCKEEE